MLWSPSEVLAYLKDDTGARNTKSDATQGSKLVPTAPFGGFQMWPSSKEDFILIAENSEIHGPNPLFTIPQLDSSIDLNALSTQILSADYQGLSNNKVLPGKNAQLLMPDLSSDIHVAINYFFLFDSEARGFVRPTCLAYFTADKHKLMMCAGPILKALGEVSEILQHTNVLYHTKDLRTLQDSIREAAAADKNTSVSKEIFTEARLKDIQDVIDVAEKYEGNTLFDKLLVKIMDYLKENAVSKRLRNLSSTTFTLVTQTSSNKNLIHRTPIKKPMKNLYHICYNGVVLGLYHLYILYKHFSRKYENIAVAEIFTHLKDDTLHFGACITSSIRKSQLKSSQIKCALHSYKIPYSLSLESVNYFECLDSTFEKLLLNLIECEDNELEQNLSSSLSSIELTDSSELKGATLNCSSYLGTESEIKELSYDKTNCQHIVDLANLWNVLEHIKIENPGIEESFLEVLKLFGDTQRLLFSVLTRIPVIVISTPKQLFTAQNFIKALSVFIPRKKDETLFVDPHRLSPLKEEDFSNFAALNFCVNGDTVETLLPVEHFHSICIMNLKDCSVTAPTYTGHLLARVEERIKAIPLNGSVFSIIVSVYSEIERIIQWWHMLTSSSADITSASEYVLSKGLNRLDIQIIEALSRLYRS